MAFTYSLEGMTARVRRNIRKKITSSFVRVHPLYSFLGMSDIADKGSIQERLGRPGAGDVFHGPAKDTAELERKMGDSGRHFRIQKYEPDDGGGVEHGGPTPVASESASENVGAFETRWTHIMEPIRINKHDLEQATGKRTSEAVEEAVGDIVDESMAPVQNAFFKRVQQQMWTDSPSGAEQNKKTWTKFLGLQHTLTKDNIYGRVDRTSVTALQPSEINATTELDSRVVELNILRRVNNGFTLKTGEEFIGLAARTEHGMGATCVITTSALWQTLADEVGTHYQIEVGDLPKHGLGGFKSPVLFYDNCYITWDPFCPAGELYMLDLNAWIVEIDPRHNFQFDGFKDKSQTEEGGEYRVWGNYSAKVRLSNESPWTSCKVKNLRAA